MMKLRKTFGFGIVIIVILIICTSCPQSDFGIDKKIKLGADGFRTWDDGSFACSCNEYKNPTKTHYIPEGDTGSGLYKIQPNGAIKPLRVYCDMEKRGGSLTLVLINSPYGIMQPQILNDAITGNSITSITGDVNSNYISGFDRLHGLSYWQGIEKKLHADVGNDPDNIIHNAIYDYYFDEIGRHAINPGRITIGAEKNSPSPYTANNRQPFPITGSDNNSSAGNFGSQNNSIAWWYYTCWNGSLWGCGGTSECQNKPWTGHATAYYD